MPRFLSDAWLDAIDAAAASRPMAEDKAGESSRLVLEQVVTGAPGGDTRYALVFDGTHVRIRRAGGARPDATLTEDYETAVAIHRGDLSPQQALMTGRIRVTGNIGALIASQDALAALDPALAAVRGNTTYGPDDDPNMKATA